MDRGQLIARQAVAADAEAIARIYNQGIADRIATFETEPRTARDIERQLEQKGEHYPTVVVEQDGQVIAFATTSTYRARPCYAPIAEHSVYVGREYRGRGAGRLALEGLIAQAERCGFLKLVSRIFPENERSLALFRSFGFRTIGTQERPARLDGVWRDVVLLERRSATVGVD